MLLFGTGDARRQGRRILGQIVLKRLGEYNISASSANPPVLICPLFGLASTCFYWAGRPIGGLPIISTHQKDTSVNSSFLMPAQASMIWILGEYAGRQGAWRVRVVRRGLFFTSWAEFPGWAPGQQATSEPATPPANSQNTGLDWMMNPVRVTASNKSHATWASMSRK